MFVAELEKSEFEEEKIKELMVGRKLTGDYYRSDYDGSYGKEVVLSAEKLYVGDSLKGVSLELHKGEILGVAGEEGNGQSELVKLITGLKESTKGEIIFDGQNVTNKWPKKLRKAGLGVIPEDRYAQGLCREMSVSDNCIAGYHGAKDICKR